MPHSTHSVRYRHAIVHGRRTFYREAGDPSAPAIILLHGFPSSSHMFRDLIPLLAPHFHVIAPDYIGFGQSDAPSRDDFTYSFDHLTDHVAGLLDHMGVDRYMLYMQDYGGPVGFRLFSRHPERVSGFVIQNANAYLEGVGELPKKIFLPLWDNRNAQTEEAARSFLAAETTRFQYLVGARDESAVSPDNWVHDQALLDRPGTDAYQLDLLHDYRNNVALYDSWHDAFRQHRPRTLILWGNKDPFFLAEGAQAFLRDLPDARLIWLDGGHFVLDEHAPKVAEAIREFFAAG